MVRSIDSSAQRSQVCEWRSVPLAANYVVVIALNAGYFHPHTGSPYE
jgi:hypothetical protein